MSVYHLLSSVNQNYLLFLFVMYQTVLDSLQETEHDKQDHLIFHALLDHDVDLSKAQSQLQAFYKLNAESKVSFEVKFYKIDTLIFESCQPMEREGKISFATYYRILFAKFLPADVKRFLYLDVDIVVRDDVREVFDQNPMRDEVLYAIPCMGYLSWAEDVTAQEPIHIFPPLKSGIEPLIMPVRNEIEAGIILVNVEQWHKQGIEQKCLDIASKWRTSIYDQDLLSLACQGKVSYMTWDWNFNVTHLILNKFGRWGTNGVDFTLETLPFDNLPSMEQLRQMAENPKIYHFIGDYKPWRAGQNLNPAYTVTFSLWQPFERAWLQTFNRIIKLFKAENCK